MNIKEVQEPSSEIAIKINNPYWKPILSIPKTSVLEKGRHGFYLEMVTATGQVTNRFGCYAWGISDELFYIGSFSEDYKYRRYKTNLHGRIHNYWQNHRLNQNGRKNTNLMVFENIGSTLLLQDVVLYVFTFDFLTIGQDAVDYAHYCEDGELVRTVEQILICWYRRQNQCAWNRG